MGYVNDVMFGALLGPQPDTAWEDSSRLGYSREGGEFERGSWGVVLVASARYTGN